MKKKMYIVLLLCLSLLSGGCGNPSADVLETTASEQISSVVNQSYDESSASGILESETSESDDLESNITDSDVLDADNLPTYAGRPYEVINGNVPFFSAEDKTRTDAFEYYSDLDELGRCGVAYANICKDLQPTTERGNIGHIKPSGWHTAKYNGYVEGNYLYNRCHLIGFQLAGENANELNLITGTRYMNCDGQLPFEDMVDDYVDETGNHVLYRVTPIYDGDNLVASGVLTEAYSVEDNGEGISFCVYCFNVQPGIGIDYKTGESWLLDGYDGEYSTETYFSTKQVNDYTSSTDEYNETSDEERENEKVESNATEYVLNTNTMKFHKTSCQHAATISESNRQAVTESHNTLLAEGYQPCKSCNP